MQTLRKSTDFLRNGPPLPANVRPGFPACARSPHRAGSPAPADSFSGYPNRGAGRRALPVPPIPDGQPKRGRFPHPFHDLPDNPPHKPPRKGTDGGAFAPRHIRRQIRRNQAERFIITPAGLSRLVRQEAVDVPAGVCQDGLPAGKAPMRPPPSAGGRSTPRGSGPSRPCSSGAWPIPARKEPRRRIRGRRRFPHLPRRGLRQPADDGRRFFQALPGGTIRPDAANLFQQQAVPPPAASGRGAQSGQTSLLSRRFSGNPGVSRISAAVPVQPRTARPGIAQPGTPRG